jgi:hypothetical protein
MSGKNLFARLGFDFLGTPLQICIFFLMYWRRDSAMMNSGFTSTLISKEVHIEQATEEQIGGKTG